jgi:acyl-CoA reductase-like NAD-dependent aldehyde dehydrogenase
VGGEGREGPTQACGRAPRAFNGGERQSGRTPPANSTPLPATVSNSAPLPSPLLQPPLKVYDEFAQRVAAIVAGLRVGDGFAPDTTHGPLINPAGGPGGGGAVFRQLSAGVRAAAAARARLLRPAKPSPPALLLPPRPFPPPALDKVAAHCADAVSKGARVLAGGGPPEGLPEGLAGGSFFAPTVLADANIDM